MKTETPTQAFIDTKPHYNLLDGLRGVAAIMVLWYHIFEGYAFAEGRGIDTFNHGYLAVDFFFILSGFVISYAYDDRWHSSMTLGDFFKRRLIRLHPMLVMGAIIGCITFCIQGCVKWDGSSTATWQIILALVLSMLFIPAYPGAAHEVRGNGEMFPLNGPSWSLFFEYIGNIIYALFIRRLSNRLLALFVAVTGVLFTIFAIFNISGYENIGVGWTLDNVNFFGGTLRMLFPFSLGMLLSRNFKPVKIRGIFWLSSAALFLLFSVPFIPSVNNLCINGIYEIFCISVAFPLIVWLGASGCTSDKYSTKVCGFLGNISYPLYITHYPIMYLFYAWLIDNKLYTFGNTWHVAIGVILFNILMAYACLKFYDEPIRKKLAAMFMNKKGK
ncbi:MAG: acyltransferase [Bacteroidaceae bacterium]|nr:acyltransferase [Bacteroidaceae bacterium]